MPEFVASESEAGQRLDVALARRLGESRAGAQRLIAAAAVKSEDRVLGKGHLLRGGEVVTYALPAPLRRP